MKKVLVILGPTASGKSDLAVALARQFNGEVISADSRQVYKHLDVATGKITQKEMGGIPHHLLDVVEPTEVFSVTDFKKQADRVIGDIHQKEKLPILCGGTMFYIDAVVDNVTLPEVPANQVLRKELEQKEIEELISILETLDKDRLEEIDIQNRVRLIRSIEIAKALGSVPKAEKNRQYNVLKIGIQIPDDILRERITLRTHKRVNKGMIEEAQNLLTNHNVSFERMEQLGLEYKYLSHFLQNKITKDELVQNIITGDWQYAKRQMTWWKRDKEIVWISHKELESAKEAINQWIEKDPQE